MTAIAAPDKASRTYLLAFPDVWFERVWNQRLESAIDELYRPEGKAHGLIDDARHADGPEAFKQFHRMILAGFPDIKFTVHERLHDGDLIAGRWSAKGTHGGPFMGRAATGKPIAFEGIFLTRMRDGAICEAHNQFDTHGLLGQIDGR